MTLRRSSMLCTALLLLAAFLISPARAEVEHPRQQWMRDSTAGLFLHWGMFTSPQHLNCAEWEHDVTAGGWTPDYWIDEALKLHASYVVLTTFHSRLGYARPWPSAIPGSCRTERDFLGELIQAGKAKGVHVLLYMTDDPQWHNEAGIETLDSAAYSAYKGHDVDLTSRDGFGEYSYDLFFEVMQRYADLGGFWIDNDNAYWERNHLYEQIRQIRPSWLLSNNNEDTPIMDTVSNEQKTGMTPAYDYPQAAFTPLPRLTEADYKLPTTGQWWYDGADHDVDFRLSTGRYITNAGSSMKSLMAETAMVNGKFPPSQEAFNNFMASWLPPIERSLAKTEGGGYMYGGMQPGFWNDGAHGVITLSGSSQFVHVLTPPRARDLVRLRDNGYAVSRVTDVRTGKQLRFSQSGGYLTILGITDWDTYDTVFEVQTTGQQGIYDQSLLRATSPAVVDGDFTTQWSTSVAQPASVTLDLGKQRNSKYLAVNQTEWSPTYARESFGRPEDSARIQDYRVYVSNDGSHWSKVRDAALPSRRGVQFIDIGNQHSRYVKLEVLNTWGGPQAPRFYQQLKIDEIHVGYAYVRNTAARVPLEAEAYGNQLSGGAHVTWCDACSQAAEVTGGSVTFPDVRVAADGTYRLQLDYTVAGSNTVAVSANGGAPVQVPVSGDSTEVPQSRAVAVPLRAGSNSITVSTGGAGLDRIAVGPLPPASTVPKTTVRVDPAGIQWVGPGQQSLTVSAQLRLDDDDTIDDVRLAPVVPAGWTVDGATVAEPAMRLGRTLNGSWTVTSPSGQDVGSATVSVQVSFTTLGRPTTVTRPIQVKQRPADRVFMREAEDSANDIGDSGVTSCSKCSGGQKVRNIGGSPDAYVLFDNVTMPADGPRTLYIEATVNGTRSYFVSVNGGAPVEARFTGTGNDTPYTVSVPVTLQAGTNSIKLYNDDDSAPDLDRISLG